ncbi:MAG: hypothetical protein J6U40_12215 [Kiritimatiellae bacterium]|nr:hypothetical protein [Kiritimatiellia bacterium]
MAAQSKRDVEITLEEIDVPVLGIKTGANTSHVVGLELIWPRTGVAKKSGEQACRLVNGKGHFDGLNWGRRILIRESVEGRFALRMTLTEDLDDEEIEKILRFCGGVFFAFAADAVEDVVPVAGKVASSPLDYLAKNIAKYPGAKIVAEGMMEMDAGELPPVGGEKLLTLQMFTAKRLLKTSRRKVGGQMKTIQRLLLEKGSPDGEITIRIRVSG